MRKIVHFVIVLAILFTLSTSYAFGLEGPIRKLGRGTANILTCPLELVKCIGEANYEDGPVAALTYGFFRGMYRTALRGAVGIFEMVTFPIPFPKNYDPVLTDPEFFLSEGLF